MITNPDRKQQFYMTAATLSPTQLHPQQSFPMMPSASPQLLPIPQIMAPPSPRMIAVPTPSPHGMIPPPPHGMMSFPSPSPEYVAVKPTAQAIMLLGDWIAYADSKNPEKYSNVNDANAPVKRIILQDGIYRVLFSDVSRAHQVLQLRLTENGRIQLYDPSNPKYSFFLYGQMVLGGIQWQNERDPQHIVSWKTTSQVLPLSEFWQSRSPSKQCTSMPQHSPVMNRNGSQSRSRRCSFSRDSLRRPDCVEQCSQPLPHTSGFTDPVAFQRSASYEINVSGPTQRPDLLRKSSQDSIPLPSYHFECPSLQRSASYEGDHSRNPTPEPESPPQFPAMHKRDSKQALVSLIEPRVDDLIGDLYAKKEDYRPNQNGRVGPPVLRGQDVIFIPAKKQAALENVVELIKEIQSTCTIVAAAKVCQKKKKRQKKGFLVYLKLSSAEEVQDVLHGPYRLFQDTVQGVKPAIFENDKKLATAENRV